MANYLNLNNGKVLTECELYDLLACGCSRKNYTKWRWENETTHVNHLGREWWKIWKVTPPSGCSGCEVPINIVAPQTIGTGELGDTLICGDGTWTGTLPITYTYQWYQDGIAIPTQDSNRLVIIEDYIGTEVWCIVTATNACGYGIGESNHVLCYGEPLALTAPQTSGSLLVGGTITRVAGTYAGTTPITLTYQWLNGGGTVLGTGTSYVVQQSDFGGTIRVKEIATNIHGSINQSTSNQTILSAPVNTAINTISGNDYVGQVLTSTTGTFIGTATITYTYQWQRDGVNIGGATASTYTIVSADADKDIRCIVTATNAYGNATATSATTYAFTAEYKAYINECITQGYSIQSTAIQKIENKGVTLALANGAWTATDAVYFTKGDGDINTKRVNLKNPTGTKGTWNGSYTMTNLVGVKGDALTAYFRTNINMNTLTKYAIGNCSVFTYTDGSTTQEGYNSSMLWGASDGTNQTLMYFSLSGFDWQAMIQSGTNRDSNITTKTASHYGVEYNGSNVVIRLDSQTASFAQTTTPTRPAYDMGWLCRNKATPDQFCGATIAFCGLGDSTASLLWKNVFDVISPLIQPAITPATLLAKLDFNDTSKLWQDVAKTIPAIATNDPIRVIVPSLGTWTAVTAGSDSERPLLSLSAINGKNVAVFNGTTSNLDFPSAITTDFSFVIVVKNDDSSLGSHILMGSNYIGITGSGYGPNSGVGGEYIFGHPSSGSIGNGLRLKNQGNAYNAFSVGVSNNIWTVMNGRGVVTRFSNSASFSFSKNGQEYLTNLRFFGKEAILYIYSGIFTDREKETLIDSLNTLYGI